MDTNQNRLPRFQRVAEAAATKQITTISIAIIDALRRYRLITASMLKALIPANERVVSRHLRQLFDRAFINRFPLATESGLPGEFVYYLDSVEGLHLLTTRTSQKISAEDKKQIYRNRDRWKHNRHLFAPHDLMIARLLQMIERGLESYPDWELERFIQGSSLWRYVDVPAIEQVVMKDADGKPTRLWRQREGSERLPLRPDGLAILHHKPSGTRAGFFYEADRDNEDTGDIMNKMRAYYTLIVKTKRVEQVYGIKRIRAVLFETPTTHWASVLRQVPKRPSVSNQPSGLFWFTASEFFTQPVPEQGSGRVTLAHLAKPEMIFDRRWLCSADDRLHSLIDF